MITSDVLYLFIEQMIKDFYTAELGTKVSICTLCIKRSLGTSQKRCVYVCMYECILLLVMRFLRTSQGCKIWQSNRSEEVHLTMA